MFQRCSIRCSMATHKGGEGPRQGRGGVVNDGSNLSSFNECPRPSSLAQPSLTAYECVVESRNASPNLMAGTILASSPHYFSAVEDYHACLMKNWLALATLRSKQNLPQSHCLYEQTNFVQPAYVEKIRYSFYANRLVTSMY
ncbi:hypothetical protein JHK85_053533 [Glycine max]|nr:hypothetical protein JHK85_053533 [Glycine max]